MAVAAVQGISVVARFRPLNSLERSSSSKERLCTEFDDEHASIVRYTSETSSNTFAFDRVFSPASTQRGARVPGHGLEAWAEEHAEVVQDRDHIGEIVDDANDVLAAVEEALLIELPAVLGGGVVNLILRLVVVLCRRGDEDRWTGE